MKLPFYKYSFFSSNTQKVYTLVICCLVAFFTIDYIRWGTSIAGDTFHYLTLAGVWNRGEIPKSELYLPGYPFVLSLLARLFNVELYRAAIIVQGVFYFCNIALSITIMRRICTYYILDRKYLLFGIVLLLSWWNFRIQKSAHADALYYTLFLAYCLVMLEIFQNNRLTSYLALALVLLSMVAVKYNSYIVLPFTSLWFLKINGFTRQMFIRQLFLLPSLTAIFTWRWFNSTFINRLNVESYQQTAVDLNLFLHSLLLNIEGFGKILLELLLNPVAGRSFPLSVYSFVAIVILFLLFYAAIMSKDQLMAFFSSYVLVYIISFFTISSLNNIAEVNHRTLNTVLLSLVLLGILLFKGANKQWIKHIVVFIFFINTCFLFYKWEKTTSVSKNFQALKEKVSLNPEAFQIADTLADRLILTNAPDELQILRNYQLRIKPMNFNRHFRYGFFTEWDTASVAYMAQELSNSLSAGDVFFFVHPATINELQLLSYLQKKRHPFVVKGGSSYIFY